MTRTIRRKSRWWRHDHPKARRTLNRRFRKAERAYFKKYRELLRPSKSRGWITW